MDFHAMFVISIAWYSFKGKIQLWNEGDRYHMLNEGDKEVWCFWDENGNWL